MSAYCNQCGTPLPPVARFCSSCGTVVAGVPPMGSQSYPGFPPYPTRLVRPIFGRQFAGVCVGLARTYNWDVGLVRILTVLAGVFIFPVAEVAYIACWIGIPEEHISEVPTPPQQL